MGGDAMTAAPGSAIKVSHQVLSAIKAKSVFN